MLNTKQTKRQWWLSASLALAAAAMLTTSCGDDDDTVLPIDEVQPDTPAPVEQPSQPDNAAQIYTANIPATIGGETLSKAVAIDDDANKATGTFQTTEKIYVYNATKGTMLDGVLNPSDISTDGKKCSLSGELTGTIDAGDQLTLLYNLNYYSSYPTSCRFGYKFQNGTMGGLIDGGMATEVSATFSDGVLSCASAAVFNLTQSVFRFKFDDGNGNAISVKSLLIESYAIAAYYYPMETEGSKKYLVSQVTVTPAAATSDYLYVSLPIDENDKNYAMNFTVTDADDNLYKGTKNAPSGGFVNGKFYHNSSAISLEKQAVLVEPTVTWTSVENGTAVEPDEYRRYDVYGPNWKSSEITISGESTGYKFYMNNGATVTLDNLTAIRDDDYFIYSAGDLNLIISGSNSITCSDTEAIIEVVGTLKISGNGTLTVTANSSTLKGLYANNYKKGSIDPSVLAAEGYTVTRSEIGTNTWTYTVAPK